MRKIINSTYISLDGVIEAPHLWPDTEGSDPDGERIQTDLLHSCDAVVMGRRTYEGFAPVWPTRSGDPYSDRINSMPKYVVSSTLKDPEWNNTTVIDGDPVGEIARLKEEPGKDIVQYGFGRLSHTMLEHGPARRAAALDPPVRDRKGRPRGPALQGRADDELPARGATPLESGIVVLSYTVASA